MDTTFKSGWLYGMSENLKFHMLDDNIGELILSNPQKRNALNAAMWADLPNVLKKAATNKSLKVLIIRGDGKHFASGADISEFGTLYATPESSAKISRDITAGMDALANFPLPTLASIRGACVGGGCGLALCCDIRFADNTSKFAITPAKLGLVYPYEDVKRLIETVGIANAKDVLFSARLISAKHAKKMGLINFRLKPDELGAAVMDYARGIASLSSQSAIVTKQMLAKYQAGQSEDTPETEQWFLDGFSSDDFKEGYTAFLEKRKPNF